MLRIGLTGGIGSGKTTVCELFHQLGVPIIDTDLIARDIVGPGSEALQQITTLFGAQLLREDGSLNRLQMRELVFQDETKRQQLEALLHPRIREEMQRQMASLNTPYVILAIPLLLEKQWQNQLDRVLVVDCSEEQQRQRAGQRDGSSAETIDRIITSQVGREERLAAADDIIDNSTSITSLRKQVEELHQQYLTLAAKN
jgi:dephospho-CoA kinase